MPGRGGAKTHGQGTDLSGSHKGMETVSLSDRHGKDHKIDFLAELASKERMNMVNFNSWRPGQTQHVEKSRCLHS